MVTLSDSILAALDRDLAAMPPAVRTSARAAVARSLAIEFDEGNTKIVPQLLRALDALTKAAAPTKVNSGGVSAGQEGRGVLDEISEKRAARRQGRTATRGADAEDHDGAEHVAGPVEDRGA